jgi:predicted ArsR family transcriptional regulator
MDLGSAYDEKIIDLLALKPQSATALAREIKVDDGTLGVHIVNKFAKEGLVEVVGAAGPNPVWGLTEKGREHRERRQKT